MMLNDFQRGKIPYYTMPMGCVPPPVEAPNASEADVEKMMTTMATADDGTTDGDEEVVSDDDGASMTDVGSTCSGLSDVSGECPIAELLTPLQA